MEWTRKAMNRSDANYPSSPQFPQISSQKAKLGDTGSESSLRSQAKAKDRETPRTRGGARAGATAWWLCQVKEDHKMILTAGGSDLLSLM